MQGKTPAFRAQTLKIEDFDSPDTMALGFGSLQSV
jgi:hypothetical protein